MSNDVGVGPMIHPMISRDALEQELHLVYQKLGAGTLHVGHCNAPPDSRVGAEGLGCSCPLGREIKALRFQVKLLLEQINQS